MPSQAPSQAGKLPDPDTDGGLSFKTYMYCTNCIGSVLALAAVFFSFQDAEETAYQSGIFAIESPQFSPLQIRDFAIEKVDSELDLINAIIDTVLDLDPDIVVGWEVQLSSWGYFSARAATYGMHPCPLGCSISSYQSICRPGSLGIDFARHTVKSKKWFSPVGNSENLHLQGCRPSCS